jgi:hypothetical protein
MLGLLETRSVQTSILAAVLFYLFANPSTFKMVKKIPGLKFVMKSATEVTHSGVVVHALLFGVVLFVCVWLINRSLFLSHYLHVVEGLANENLTEHIDDPDAISEGELMSLSTKQLQALSREVDSDSTPTEADLEEIWLEEQKDLQEQKELASAT